MDMSSVDQCLARGRIAISINTQYIAEQSDETEERYVFAYTIKISNQWDQPAQLLNRHWIITDAGGEVEEVRGAGVVGHQPRLSPGEAFEYTSGAILKTPVGTMQGSYEFVDDDGNPFIAPIDVFSLSVPNMVH